MTDPQPFGMIETIYIKVRYTHASNAMSVDTNYSINHFLFFVGGNSMSSPALSSNIALG